MGTEGAQLITFGEAAQYAGVPLRTVQHAARKGHLETVAFSTRHRLTTREMVDRWLKSRYKRTGRVKKS